MSQAAPRRRKKILALVKLTGEEDEEGETSTEESDEEKPPAVDVDLAEAEHILVDYLSVLSKDHVLTARH